METVQGKSGRIRLMLCGLTFLVVGWYTNDGYRYVAGVFEKAALCDQINCEQVKVIGDKMVEMELPALKPHQPKKNGP